MKFLDLFEGAEESVPLVADSPRCGGVVHLTVVNVDDVLHVGDEFLFSLDELAYNGPVNENITLIHEVMKG